MDGMARFPKRDGGVVAAPRIGGAPPATSTTGYPWIDGDILYAADLNAAFDGGASVAAINPITNTFGIQSFPTDIYQSPDSYALTGSMTIRGQPYGYYDTATLLSLVASPPPLSSYRAGVSGGFENGVPAIAGYGTFDSVNFYSGNPPAPPPLVLHSVTYDATHVYPQTPLTAAQMRALRINMFVLTNSIDTSISPTPPKPNAMPPERHYGSYVTGWAADGTSITVVGWTVPGSGHTATGQVPSASLDPGAANATAYFGAMTNVFAANFVLQNHSSVAPDSRIKTYQGMEIDFQNWDSTNYAIRAMGISMSYNALGGAKLSSDSYGIKLVAFPTCLILQEIAGYTDVLLNSFVMNVFRSESPVPWAGVPTTNLTWEAQNYIDSNILRLQCWASRDASGTGWPTASVHLGLRVDGTPLTMSGGSPMAQIVWNPQNFEGGLQLQNEAGVAGLTVDSNAWVYPRVVNAADDAAALAAGVPVGAAYRNGSVLMVRVT
jgi:hypothetical protein